MKKLLVLFFTLSTTSFLLAQSKPNLKNFTGKYTIEGGGSLSEVIISVENGTLYGVAVGQGEASLSPTANADEFSVDGYGGKIVFKRNPNKIVNAMTLTLQGQDMEGKRVFPPLSDFIGTYNFENAQIEKLVVTLEDDVLYGEVEGLGKTNFESTSNLDDFFENNYGSTLTFVRDNEGKVTGITILSQGNEMKGSKGK